VHGTTCKGHIIILFLGTIGILASKWTEIKTNYKIKQNWALLVFVSSDFLAWVYSVLGIIGGFMGMLSRRKYGV
jgi:hypothetical protein